MGGLSQIQWIHGDYGVTCGDVDSNVASGFGDSSSICTSFRGMHFNAGINIYSIFEVACMFSISTKKSIFAILGAELSTENVLIKYVFFCASSVITWHQQESCRE